VQTTVLITCDAESEALTREELRRCGFDPTNGEWLDTGDAVQGAILRFDPGIDFSEFSELLESRGSIFVRHVVPVDDEVALAGDESDIANLVALINGWKQRLNADRSFSVQTRILGEGKLPYRKVVLNETISNALQAGTGATMDCRSPEQVVSILCTPSRAYVGLSDVKLNRSAWPGGKHRFKRDDDQVSRAEFKLLEAMNVFNLALPKSGLALDIGASPGGWTRVLASQGLKVDAVDPGELDGRLRANRLVNYVPRRIQDYNPGSKRFVAIVNDMKMDPRESVVLMLRFAHHLESEGLGLITLKMPKATNKTSEARRALEMIRKDLDHLRQGFEVIGARQMYHNRSEVTVALRPLD
jgi:23S rRNA (cytidine2498-2'-O)-methyltransferase